MTLDEMKLTYHAQIERANRLEALEEVLGYTRIVLEVIRNEKRYCLTSSGIIIVKSIQHTDMVITAYMATIKQCERLYRWSGKSQVSPKMRKRVEKNTLRHSELFYI